MTEHYENLKKLVDLYTFKRAELFKSYDRVKDNEAALKYQARELFIGLYATAEAAQECDRFFHAINQAELGEEEKKDLSHLFQDFQTDAQKHDINIKTPDFPDPQITYDPTSEFNPNLDEAKKLLPLMQDVLGGLSKMTHALYGDYVDIEIVNEPFYSGLMNINEELKIDYNRLLSNREVFTHIFFHEVGHADEFQFNGMATRIQDTFHVSHVYPKAILEAPTPTEKSELTADFFSAIGFAIFDIPHNIPLSMMQQYAAMQNKHLEEGGEVKHSRFSTRAAILQQVIPTLKAQFFNNELPQESRWGTLAGWFKAQAQLNYTDLPDKDILLSIAEQFPDNICRQKIEVSRHFPNIYSPDLENNYPSEARISNEVLELLEGKELVNQVNTPMGQTKPQPTVSIPQAPPAPQPINFPQPLGFPQRQNPIIFNQQRRRPIGRLQQQIPRSSIRPVNVMPGRSVPQIFPHPLMGYSDTLPTPRPDDSQAPSMSPQPLLFSGDHSTVNGHLALAFLAGQKIAKPLSNLFSKRKP